MNVWLHGGRLASAVVTKEGSNLILIKNQIQILDGLLPI